MANKGTKTIKVTDYNNLIFKWETKSQDIDTNTSIVGWELWLEAKEHGRIISQMKKNGSLRLDNREFSLVYNLAIDNNQTKLLDSGQKTITHNADGTYAFSYGATVPFDIYFGDSTIGTITFSGNAALDTIPRMALITNAVDFTDIQNPTITYNNQMGEDVDEIAACISLTGEDVDIAYRSISKSGTSYTFNLTEEERNILRQATIDGNSRTVRFYVRTKYGDKIFFDYLSKTFTVVDAQPTLAPLVVDANDATVSLTGTFTRFVKYYSDLQYEIGSKGQKFATITEDKATLGGITINDDSGVFNAIEHDKITFTTTDSRKNTATMELPLDMVNYVKLTSSVEAEAANTDGELPFTVKGKCFNSSFGAVDNLIRVEYRYKTNDSDYTAWTAANISLAGDRYTSHVTLTGLDYRKTYTIQVKVNDRLTDAIPSAAIPVVEVTKTTMPIFDWSSEDFNFNVPVSFQGDVLDDFVVESGTESMGSNGTWYWRKWRSGAAECWGKRNYGNMGFPNAFGSWYQSEVFSQDLPSGLFAAEPDIVTINIIKTNGAALMIQGCNANASANGTGGFALCKPTNTSLSQVYLGFYVRGRY